MQNQVQNLSVKVEKLSPISRKLSIKVPAEVVGNRILKGLQEVQKTAKIKGFRPGHVPLPMVKQFYGSDVNHHVFHKLIDESFQQALTQEKLKAVGSPKIETPDHKTGTGEHDHGLQEGKDLNFTATVEILPEVEVTGYTGIALTRASDQVLEKDFDKAIEQLRGTYATLKTNEDTSYKAKKGDYVQMDFKGAVQTDKGFEERDSMKGSKLLEIGSEQYKL
jgi:trigger factor